MHFSDRKHILRLAAQQEDIKRIFDRFAREAGAQLERWTPKAAPGVIHPSDVWLHNRVAEKRIEKLLDQLHTDLVANIDANTRAAWEDSNRKVDEMIRDFIADIPLSETFRRGMFTRNAEGLRAFMQRKHAGMNLSDRIWSVVEGARENMEFYLASGIAEGRPATLLSQDIRYILKEPDKRFRRVRNADGKLVMSQPMKDYHPGRGVYRSSYMNALRVGATETNIAYHESDHQRWQSLDFVLGVKVERSGTSAKPCPVCDAMKGTYPKGFKFLPWHPFCICHATPVMLSGQEFTDYLVTGRMPAGRVLRDMPAGALEYVEQHPSYRTSYSYLHNVPFFDKEAAANVSGGGAPAKPSRPEKTAWQKEDIQRRWNTRVSTNRHAAALEAIAADFADVPSITLLGGKVSGRIAAGADPSEVDALMARLRHKIEVKKAWEDRRDTNYLSVLLDNVPEYKKKFGSDALHTVYDSVEEKIAGWEKLPLDKQLKKAKFEAIEFFGSNKYGAQKKYATWEVARDAYKKHCALLEYKIAKQEVEWDTLHAFGYAMTTKSKNVKMLASELESLLNANAPLDTLQTKASEFKSAVDKLEAAKAARAAKTVKGSLGSDVYTQARKDAALWDKTGGQKADDMLIGTASKNWMKAPAIEKDMIYDYSKHYCDVNEPLQGRKYENPQTREKFERKVNAITSYIERNALPEDMWFTRGDSGLDVIASRIRFAGGEMPSKLDDLVGMTMQEGGFLSTGSRKWSGYYHKPVVLNIYAPKGTRAAYIEPISYYGSEFLGLKGGGRGWDGKTRFSKFGQEQETLFQRGLKMRITKVYRSKTAYGDQIFIDCEVVGQEFRDLSKIKDVNIGY